MHPWLDEARVRLATSVGDAPAEYDLTASEIDELLEAARVAAHESGERPNAPLLCYLLGVARSRHRDRTLADLVDDATGGTT